ncbi:RdgB/HAM1 family non-canonical purine NTP pyrophosphatase [Eubacterium aggregans]|uniref:RdgB/HAM1 family non-canonical purine NTP pyrophosphatase n=1 Tax=Eubacterium aggregans TaxID=81409 RepID=UPI003F394E2C
MKTIILATGNPNKAIELKEMLDNAYAVKTMGEVGIDLDIIEDGETFEDNALIKVRAIAPYVGDQDIIMGDDSGLSVDALNGAPGVYSARYAGEHVTYADNNAKLLKEMAAVPDGERGAAFICCVALILPGGEEWTGRGTVRGTIAHGLRGAKGFGYDHLFIEETTGQSYAEMGNAAKNKISHRGRAIALAKAKLDSLA